MLMPDFSEILSEGGVNMVRGSRRLDSAATAPPGRRRPPIETQSSPRSMALSRSSSRYPHVSPASGGNERCFLQIGARS